MNLRFLCRVGHVLAIGAILLSASCVKINEELGQSLIPTDQKWDVFPQEPVDLENIMLHMSDSLSAYSTTRFTFGAVNDGSILGTFSKVSSMTLVPIGDTLDFGRNTRIRQFHFTAVRDTLSTVKDNDLKILQNVYVSELKKPLDSTIVYTSSLSNPETLNEYVDLSSRITAGIPVYSGGDSLSFDFSMEFAEKVVAKIDEAQKAGKMDSVDNYLKYLPGGLRMYGCYVLAHKAYLEGDYSRCLTFADAGIALSMEPYPIPTIYSHIIAAVALMNLKRRREAEERMEKAWALAQPDDLIQPFGEHHGLLQGLIEIYFKKERPKEYERIIAITYAFSRTWREIHNPDTGHDVADNLSTMEFTIAMLYSRGWSAKEIGGHMNLSIRRVRDHLTTIYEKLDVRNRDEMRRFMLL